MAGPIELGLELLEWAGEGDICRFPNQKDPDRWAAPLLLVQEG